MNASLRVLQRARDSPALASQVWHVLPSGLAGHRLFPCPRLEHFGGYHFRPLHSISIAELAARVKVVER